MVNIKKEMNGSVELFSKALRQLVVEAASAGVEPHIKDVMDTMGYLEETLLEKIESTSRKDQQMMAKNLNAHYGEMAKRIKKIEKRK